MAQLAFFGTPTFALSSLQEVANFCHAQGHTLCMVVCQPDQPSQRGQKRNAPPVKALAQTLNIPVFQPTTLKKDTPDGDLFFEQFKSAHIDLAIVVAYGKLIPKRFLDLPRCGFINVHGSLLPRWRGAAPIQRALEAGDEETGVSIMSLVPELDAGDVYQKKHLTILQSDDSESLFQKLSVLGAQTLIECLPGILSQTLPKTPQDPTGVTYAPMLQKQEGQINFNLPAKQVVNHCRAMQPWPGNFTTHNGKVIRLFNPSLVDENTPHSNPGLVLEISPQLVIAAKQGALSFAEAQLEGKKRLPMKEFLNGYALQRGNLLA